MKFTGTAALLLFCAISSYAQLKTSRRYHFPAGITQHDVIAGQVLVKIKPQYKSLFQSGLTNGRTGLKAVAVRPVSASKKSSVTARGSKPVVDISQYFELRFDPSENVETYLNRLYESGLIEYGEPVYKEHMQFTPNDANISAQYYLGLIKAFEAWDITQGSEDVIIAVIDSGVDADHPDIASQLYTNVNDPVNGIDDDDNGYVDDIHGWDFSGADEAAASDPNFVGDNDPSIGTAGPGFNHGTSVGSLASAATHDGIGMAGVGFKSKLMFTKHFSDNQAAGSRSYSSNLYRGLVYAAENGADIINCSWGGTARSQVYQDFITWATLDMGCVIVAAAGNSNNAVPLYPASYDYVLSVASTDANDKKTFFSSFGSTVDICAPGISLLVAEYNNVYKTDGSGTSFSAPMVSGAAALLRAHFPEYTALQIAEQLRISADESIYDQNPTFLHQLGKGRLDIQRALTVSSPSVRASNPKLVNENGFTAEPGQHAFLSVDFTNYLADTSPGLTITVETLSPYVTITKSVFAAGAIPTGTTINNANNPFELDIAANVPENTAINIVITYEDGAYLDHQPISFVPNPSYRNIDDNLITTSISSSGRLAYENAVSASGGNGFMFNGQNLVYEMGLIMGGSSATILNTVRGAAPNTYDKDFVAASQIREILPGERSYAEIFGDFSNSATPAAQNVLVNYRSLVWRESPYDKFVILEYKIKNPQATALTNFNFGIFADWDISLGGASDVAKWDASTRMGYVHPKTSSDLPQAGVQLLTGPGHYYAIANDQTIAGNPFGLYDGYTDSEKFTSISTDRLEAGTALAAGTDVSHVISAGPFTINSGEEITIAFALHGAANLEDLLTSAKYADSLYNYTLQAPKPVTDTVETCYGANATLTATGASMFKWYSSFTGGEALATGIDFTPNNLTTDTSFYISNADNTFESVRTPAFVAVQAKPQVVAEGPTSICSDGEVVLTADSATSYLWSNSMTTRSITVTEPGDYSVVVSYVNEDLDCESTSNVISIEELPAPIAAFSFEPADVYTGEQIQFTDESTDAVTWRWDFDDGGVSTDQSPKHTFDEQRAFNVNLTVTNSNGCRDVETKSISAITAAESALESFVTLHPNPSPREKLTVSIKNIRAQKVEMSMLNVNGQELHHSSHANIADDFSTTIAVNSLSPGIYMVMINVDGARLIRKVMIY